MTAASFSPRLLAGPPLRAGAESLPEHLSRHGPLPSATLRREMIPVLEASGLLGRGGAGFPVGRKWRSVAERSRGGAVVLVNGAEGEPGSAKDRALMASRPHLVLDGAEVAAEAVGGDEIVVYVGSAHRAAIASLRRAMAEQAAFAPVPVRLVEAPPGYVSGEETAAVHFIDAGDARPTSSPPRPYERGIRGLPTLVQNAESLAHVALIARRGDEWYRAAGRGAARGTALVTVSGPVERAGVGEIELGTTVGEVLTATGARRGEVRGVLLGGFFGAWADIDTAWDLALDPLALRERGLTFGAGVVSILDATDCGVRATARIMAYMAGESVAQCGPCVFGLRSLADASRRIALCAAERDDLARIERWTEMIRGRGACAHPTGAVGLLASALRAFGDEFALHQRERRCSARARAVEVA